MKQLSTTPLDSLTKTEKKSENDSQIEDMTGKDSLLSRVLSSIDESISPDLFRFVTRQPSLICVAQSPKANHGSAHALEKRHVQKL